MEVFYLKYVDPTIRRYLRYQGYRERPSPCNHIILDGVTLLRPLGPFSAGSYFKRGNVDIVFTEDGDYALLSVDIPLYIPKPTPNLEEGETAEENIEDINVVPTAYIPNPLIRSLATTLPFTLERFNEHLEDERGIIILPTREISPAQFQNLSKKSITVDLSSFLEIRFQISTRVITH